MSDEAIPFGRDYWEARYAAPGYTWSGNPNVVLVAEAKDLAPGHALDIGSGEGGDAIWLAKAGWQVTSVDIAVNALDKARLKAESVDPAAATRIEWIQRDLTEWTPPTLTYDLISSHFMHLPEPGQSQLFGRLAAALAPGGTLLIVGHDAADHGAGQAPAHHRGLMFTVDDVTASLSAQNLVIEVAESRARESDAAHHDAGAMHDIVVRARRA